MEMPENTWFTPYKFPPSRCLSLGPSRGIVYKLFENAVVKLHFQHPIKDASSHDIANEHLCMSLRSFAVFKKERVFFDLLAEKATSKHCTEAAKQAAVWHHSRIRKPTRRCLGLLHEGDAPSMNSRTSQCSRMD